MIKQNLFLIFISYFLIACATGKKERKQFRESLKSSNFDSALGLLEKSKLKENPEDRLLFLLEKATTEFMAKKHFAASTSFEQAKSLMEELYTKRISQVLKAGVVNERMINFYGDDFERSYVYFFSALNYFSIYQLGRNQEREFNLQEKRSYLFKARADMLAWDSFFKNIQRSKSLSTLYFNDIWAKIFASLIHESVGGSNDLNIALKLIQDGEKILSVLAPVYPEYNAKADVYADSLLNKIAKDFNNNKKSFQYKNKEPTQNYQNLKDYLEFKKIALLKKLRRSSYRSQLKKTNISSFYKGQLQAPKKNISTNFVINLGMISPVKADKIDLSLKAAFDPKASGGKKALSMIGYVAFSHFAYNVLGLKPQYRSTSSARAYRKGYQVSGLTRVLAHEAAIDFEVPTRSYEPAKENLKLKLESLKDKKEIEIPVVLVGPISSIGKESTQASSARYLATAGTRFLVKQVAAMATAYTTYKTVEANQKSSFLAKAAAISTYLGGSKLISLSEQADTRHWTSLPSNIYLAEINLPPGKYKAKLYYQSSSNKKTYKLGQVEIKDQGKNIFSYRVWTH